MGKEEKLWLFADDLILYIENLQDAKRKVLELINIFGKVEGYKINTQKSLASLYSNSKSSEREIKETISVTTATKWMKYLGIKITMEAKKKLYLEKYKILIRAIKVHKQMERYTMFFDWKNQYCENNYTTQRNLQIQCSLFQITNGIFHRIRKKINFQCVW